MTVLRELKFGSWLLLATAAFAHPATAIDAPVGPPVGPVVLTISGAISETNSPAGLAFDQAALDRLTHVTVKTETPWTQGLLEFSGVPLKALLDLAGAKGSVISAFALNEYSVEIPMSDADIAGLIIADRKNGTLMPVRDKGPLWIIYPLSDQPELQTEETHAKMIWQLKQLEIK
ncbi:hypothetical protein [Dongia sp.]|uniref:hypothetical protein n=1 Tax=Dongia sp. TaxID=1977262 RepID=UPI0035B022A2